MLLIRQEIGEGEAIALGVAALTAMGRANIGPAVTKEWNSPFSPHGSVAGGSSASSARRTPARETAATA